jgi:hypothetical protein
MMDEVMKALPELTIITVGDYAMGGAGTGDVDVNEFGDVEMEEPETRTLNWERGLRSDDEDELGVRERTWRVETHSEKAGNGE